MNLVSEQVFLFALEDKNKKKIKNRRERQKIRCSSDYVFRLFGPSQIIILVARKNKVVIKYLIDVHRVSRIARGLLSASKILIFLSKILNGFIRELVDRNILMRRSKNMRRII